MRTNLFQRWVQSLFARYGQPKRRRPRRHATFTPAACIESLGSRILLTATTIGPAADGYATDTGLDGTFDTLNTTSDNNITQLVSNIANPFENRGLMDFNISQFSAGNQVNSATLNFTVSSITGPSGASVIVDIEGYSRSGVLTTSDATAAATQIGTASVPNSIAGLTTYSITLDPTFVQGLLGHTSDLGIITRVDPTSVGDEIGFYSTRATYVPLSERPSLVIDSTPTQPGLTVTTNLTSIPENAGVNAVTGTVVRQEADISQPLTVSLTSSDTTRATVPATVTIGAGQISATFGISPVDDTILEGTTPVTITASSTGFTSGSAKINVTDYETLSLSLAASTIPENAGPAATTGTITRNNTNIDQPLTVTLSSSNSNQAAVTATVTIAAGQASATFPVGAVDDIVVDGTQTVNITATAAGYAGPASAALQVTETDSGHIRPQDILISTNNAGNTLAIVREYTTAGLLVQQFSAPATEEARDLVVDENGLIQLYNGTFSATLTTIDPATGNSTEESIPGLSTVNNVSFGGIATFHQYVYLTDMGTAGAGGPQGVVRVDLTNGSWQRFATDKQFQALTIGEDGLLYGLDGSGLPGNTVTVYNPVTMQQVRTVTLSFNDWRGIAVDANGQIFASGWDGSISHFDTSGNLLASVATGVNNLDDIALRADGTLVAGSRFGQVVLADVTLNSANITHINTASQSVFAAFASSTVFPRPTVDTTPGSLTYTENDPPTAIDPGVLVTTDGEQLTGATVQLGTGFQSAQDVLAFTNQNGISGSYDTSTGTLTLSGAASASQYQAALDSVTYVNTSDNPDATPRTVTFSVSDGTYVVSASKTVTVIPVDDPPVITANQSLSVAENTANGTIVGTVAATDVDSPASALQAYTIVSGNTNSAFVINSVTGQITVADGTQLDWETTNSFALGVTVSDGQKTSAVGNVTVNVINGNDDPPVITANQSFSAAENAANGAIVGTVAATDVDSPASALQGYTIVSGNTNNAFAINAATGQITVADGSQLDWETTSSFTLGVTVSDGKNTSAVGNVTVSVINGNDDPPVITANQSFSAVENAANGTIVGTVAVTDVDSPTSALQAYTIVSGNTNNAFAINAVTGQITVADGTQLDWETTSSFTLGVTVSDGKNTSATGNVTVNVINGNDDPPVIAASQSFSAAENAANGTVVGTVAATDVDSPASALQAYSIVSGNTSNAFAINAATGQITVADGSQLDWETTNSFTLGVTVSDGKNTSAIGNVTVNVINGNDDPPVIAANQSFSAAENAPNGTVVGTVAATDVDSPASSLQGYTIVSGNTNNAFAINAATGQITVANGSQLDYEAASSYTLGVTVSDGKNTSGVGNVTIAITDTTAPPVVASQNFSLLEKSPNGTLVGTASATNPDADDSLTFSIVSGNTNNAFAINSATGQITVADSTKLSFLAQSSYSLSVRAADAGSPNQAGTATVTIQLIFQPGIDIKPGDSTNTINLKRDTSIQVAILSAANFNATTQVNVSSLRFGATGTEASLQLNKKGQPQFSFQDVNHDGRQDLVVTFVTSKTGLQAGDTQAILTGSLVSGAAFESFGPVNVVGQTQSAKLAVAAATQPLTTDSTSTPSTATDPSNSGSGDIASAPIFIDTTTDDQHRKS